MEWMKYYIIRTDDWDRYYYEIFEDNELLHITINSKEAEEFVLNLQTKKDLYLLCRNIYNS